MKLGDPKKARDIIQTLDNICLCVGAVFVALLLWSLLWLFGG